jgi:toluene monooxygenase system ferredoxin subunit
MSKQRVCSLQDVPANGMRTFETEGGLRVLVVNSGEDYFAYQPICPHQDVELEEGMYDGCVLTCHMHLWQWDIRTGNPMGLAEAPLVYYDVKIEDGSLFIVSPSALKMADLFDGIAERTLDQIIGLARNETHEEGSVLYRPGDPVEDFYVLESGRVNFSIGREERTRPAGFMLRKGEIFGWAALLENQPQRIASASCLEKSTLLAINGKETLKVLESDPAAGFVVMRRLSSLITKHLTASGAE